MPEIRVPRGARRRGEHVDCALDMGQKGTEGQRVGIGKPARVLQARGTDGPDLALNTTRCPARDRP
jgi:hypothetical protein